MLANRLAMGALLYAWLVSASHDVAAQTGGAIKDSLVESDNSESIDDEHVLLEDFQQPLTKPWRWIREHREGWRLTDEGLQVMVEPGNMWGKANDARNVLVRPAPDEWRESVEVSVQVEHHPQNRWEQANLVWYYSDSTMVKLGLELENGKTNIVMGREEKDKTQTIAVVPYEGEAVQLRFVVAGRKISGYYRHPTEEKWTAAGSCELPTFPGLESPQVSLQFYQGEAGSDRWATVSKFRMARLAAEK